MTTLPPIKRGSIVVYKRLLADLIAVVQGVEGDGTTIRVRFMDSPRNEVVSASAQDIIVLNEEQELQLPTDFLGAIKKQREVIFSPKVEKKERVKLEKVLKNVKGDALDEIMKVIVREQESREEV